MDIKQNFKSLEIQETLKDTKNYIEDDYVTKSMGAFGLWQLLFILVACSTRNIATWNTMSIIFMASETNFACKKFSDNATAEVKNNTCYDTCTDYEYRNVIFKETVISEFGLICKNSWLQSFVQTILMLGMLCGVALFGWFSDRFGRSKATVLCGIIGVIFMLATPFCPNLWSFCAARLCSGIGTGGYLALTTVYLSELSGTRIVDIVLCSFILPFDGIALPIQGVFAYFTSTWRTFMIVCSSFSVPIVCLTFILPETPRWFVAKGKTDEAIQLLTRAAKFNKLDTSNIAENVKKVTERLNLKEKKDINLTYLDLFRTKKLATWTVASISTWFVTGFSYFGLLQYISTFGSNFYMVVLILGVAQVLAAPLSVAVMKFCRRKIASVLNYFTIGALSLALIFIPKGSVTAVALGSLGVIAASVSFCLVYIIVIELYPTPLAAMTPKLPKATAVTDPLGMKISARESAPIVK